MTRRSRWAMALAWSLLALVYVGLVARGERHALESELGGESAVMHRIVSQRADQHDAHLTSLAALALSDAPALEALFLEVADAIRRFYPRIVAIDLAPLHPELDPAVTTRESGGAPGRDQALRSLARELEAPTVVRSEATPAGHYLLVKRVPSDPSVGARFMLALEIDAAQLLETDERFWELGNTSRTLAFADGDAIVASIEPTSSDVTGWRPLAVEATLGSRTQPLRLITRLHPRPRDLFPGARIGIGLLVMATIPIVAWSIHTLLARTRIAELRARVGEQDAKLSRASRINALGEMASAIAHELTQPLTAILSQSQAGLRLLGPQRGEENRVREVLEANVTQSRRAASILGRLRTWTERSSDRRERVDVNTSVRNVALLLGAEARRTAIELTLELTDEAPVIVGDPVALEQVVFNLVRNGMDAVEGQPSERTIRIVSALAEARVEIAVSDSGPGIDPSMANRLFEPFASAKPGGMGLGLSLCERIVERMGGEIEIGNATRGVVARLRFPEARAASAIGA